MSDMNGKEAEWARAPPPPSGPIWTRVATIIYNPEEKSILGRTPKRWGIVITFYLMFYAVLAALTAACVGGLLYSLDPNRPTYTLHQSLIGANPGVTVRPLPLEGNVVNYDNQTFEKYFAELEEFIEPYKKEAWYPDVTKCINVTNTSDNPYSPCLFVKLNKIFDWTPDYYDVANLPADMPPDLKEHIQSDPSQVKQVWVSCFEEHTNVTLIEYPWGRHLLGRFPFKNDIGHLSPLLAVKITAPVNQLVTIRCRAWAKNIIYNKSLKEPSGYARIQLCVKDSISQVFD